MQLYKQKQNHPSVAAVYYASETYSTPLQEALPGHFILKGLNLQHTFMLFHFGLEYLECSVKVVQQEQLRLLV